MKLILTGATGLIGGGALQSALANPAVTSIVVLSRRDIGIQHPKLHTIIKKNYLEYEASELEQLKGAEACIWALGAPTGGLEVHVQLPHAALDAFSSTLAPHILRPFRFVLLSGGLVVRNQERRMLPGLSLLQVRGKVELDFIDFEAQHQDLWRSIIAQPMMVVKPGSWGNSLYPNGFKILLPTLGAALVDAAVNGSEGQTLDNLALKTKGEKALAKQA